MRAARLAVVVTGSAIGVRRTWAQMPRFVHDWVDAELGSPVVASADQRGGFSPGCATRVLAADGTRAFVKAVGAELNADTPVLFRREVAALRRLGSHPLWAGLLAALDTGPDGGDWVVLLLEDVEGRHPDLTDDATMARLLEATDALVDVLGERAAGIVPGHVPAGSYPFFAHGPVDLHHVFAEWLRSFDAAPSLPDGAAPRWLSRHHADLRAGVHALTVLPCDHPVHYDVRDDNLIERDDGSIVFVDWGAFGVGPAWLDPLLARLGRVEEAWFDTSLASSPALAAAGDDVVTSWLVGMGTHAAVRAAEAADASLPTLNDFRRRQSARLLAAAARRLDLGP